MELSRVLDCPNGPRQLRLHDQPNGYYNAVVDGDISFQEDIEKQEARGSINFVIPDGIFYSDYISEVNSSNLTESGRIVFADGVSTCTLRNHGSVPAFPKIKIKSTSSNGHYSIVGQNGVAYFGTLTNSDDTYQTQNGVYKSDELLRINRGDTSTNGWGRVENVGSSLNTSPITDSMYVASGGQMIVRRNQTGTRPNGTAYDTWGLAYDEKATNYSAYKWFGAAGAIELPADDVREKGAINFKLDFNLKFWASKMGQTGICQLALVDDNNKLIFGISVEKDDTNGNSARCVTYIEKDKPIETIKFESNNYERKSKVLDNYAFNSESGECSITKEGPVITFSYLDKKYTYRSPLLDTRKAHKIILLGGHYSGRVASKGNITKWHFESLRFTKNNVERLDVVPNPFTSGSLLVVDMKRGESTIIDNPDTAQYGKTAGSIMLQGSSFFTIPPGTSTIQISQSDWNTAPPEIVIEWQEGWNV